MPLIFLFALLLSGCSSEAEAVESQLNAYALAASRGLDTSSWLTGKALESDLKSFELRQSLGLSAYGVSHFSQTEVIAKGHYRSCLDVSGTEFRDSDGTVLETSRLNRQLVEVLRQGDLVSDITLSGVPC